MAWRLTKMFHFTKGCAAKHKAFFSKFCLSSAGLQNGRQIVFLSQFMHVKGPSDGVGVGVGGGGGGMRLAIVQADGKATQ